ncbi:AAC_HP2_G0009250.mRNA.1.CDS.1 [Saccharomyces cerevisiae]|nr:AAC_HP2_G0009250.mRNA.1.CDS.1 [Saccharomyces cerevisiae]CAI6430220.1 AAC_HP2_G0009250.mRNA.1.CDS.1 [Saccharomyces cerevisiae]CAI6434392.1 AAC_HP1_G0010340.mRNA.1.CDS.1 [Saccharomyces cerevisiae]CAI6555614.1 AAC_collapsed_G0009610.mRNA.1.CDS.1 [Saccharomyces cerevisiae]CAI7070407.1 BBF_collapsed_G0009640.mRNA.1.CDS.1 [Saccharomyces cerevisiae]
MLSIQQRYNICLMAERHPKWTQLELAKWAYETFQLPKIPSQGTISRLLARKSTYMNCKEHEKDANRLRKPNNLLVRKILQEWISQSLWNGIPITSPIIQDTAQAVWHRIPAEHREGNGSFSYKWISNFLSKMDVNISVLDEELPKTPKVWTFEERDVLKAYFSKIPPKDLFTLDEAFLSYNLPLDYAQYEASSIQRRIEVATVMLCSNLDGSEKLKPVVVGKYDSYKSFRNYFPNEPNDPVSQSMLGTKMAKKFDISYHSNRKAWLTSNLFHNWLVRWDKRLVAVNRKIWIVLDDSCCHRIINLRLQNINLVYTSSNSKFLPFNWGVWDEFKTRYRIQQYQALIDLQNRISKNIQNKNKSERNECIPNGKKCLISFEQSQLTMSNAFKFIKKAWDDIPVDAIKANWKSSGLLPPEMIHLNENVSMAFKKNEVLESVLNRLCDEYYCVKKWEYEMLLDLNIENKNTNFLSTEELVESAIVEPCEPDFDTAPKGNEVHDDNFDVSVFANEDDNNQNHLSMSQASHNPDYNSNHSNNAIENTNNRGSNNNNNNNGSSNNINDNDSSVKYLQQNTVDNSTKTGNPGQPNISSTESQRNSSTTDLVVDGNYDVNFNGLLNDPYNTMKQPGPLDYNVSTLIDKPNLFLSPDLDLSTVGVDMQLPSSEYFSEVFSSAIRNNEKAASDQNKSTDELPSSTAMANSNSITTALLESRNQAQPFDVPHMNGLLSDTSKSGHSVNSSNAISQNSLNNFQHNSASVAEASSPSITPSPVAINSTGAPARSIISAPIDSNSSASSPSALEHLEGAVSGMSPPSTTILSNLQTNINIAKSLSTIMKHAESNEISLTKETINELNFNYLTLLKRIKKTRKQLNSKSIKINSKNAQDHLETLLSGAAAAAATSANNLDLPTGGSNLPDSNNLHLPGNTGFF